MIENWSIHDWRLSVTPCGRLTKKAVSYILLSKEPAYVCLNLA